MEPMTSSVVICEVDALMYVVLTSQKNICLMGNYVVLNVWYSQGITLTEVVLMEVNYIKLFQSQCMVFQSIMLACLGNSE